MKIDIEQDIALWNNRFPLDRWFRKKHKTPFLSYTHREFTFYAEYFEYHEDRLFKKYFENKNSEEEQPQGWWEGLKASKEEIEDWFNTPIGDG